MKRLTQSCLIVMIALLCASTASAFEARMTSAYAGQPLGVGDTVDIDVHFDATTVGVQLLSLGFLFETAELVYVPQTNASVGVPSYILFGGSMPSRALYAQQTTWLLWPGTTPPGLSQVNINWADTTFTGTAVTGSDLKIAQIRFQVVSVGDGASNIQMSVGAGGNIFQVTAVPGTPGDPNTPITLVGSPIALNLPEPTVGALAMTALVSLAVVRRRARKV
jgi:hypothetical protein